MINIFFTRNHFLKVFLISILLSALLWAISFFLAIDKSIFIRNHSFLYQTFWLPIHILLAYFSIIVYKKAAFGIHHKDISLQSIYRDLHTNYRAVIAALLLVTPFIVEDLIEGYSSLQENFHTLGNASWVMIGPVWIIEWLMLAVIWSRVLATIRLTVKTYSAKYVDENLDMLLILSPNSPLLQAGVENALINFLYAVSTIGYIEYAGGESSDYQNVVISAALVLFSFLTSFFFLRMRVNEALERLVLRYSVILNAEFIDNILARKSFGSKKLNTVLVDSFVLFRPPKLSNRALQRTSIVRASLLMQSLQEFGYSEEIAVPMALEAIKYGQYEQKLASLGIVELQGVLIRLASPLVMAVAKSGAVAGLH